MRAVDTILLTEDDSTDVLLLRRAFQKAGVANRLEVVSDGEQAISYLAGEGPYADRARHPLPSLVLMDIKLPRKSGLEVLAWLRQQPRFKRLPVVMLTSSGRPADISQAYDSGASAYHEKPAGLEGLIELVRSLDRSSFVWTEPVANDRRAVSDDRMFPPGADQGVSVKSKVYGLLSRHPAGLTPAAVAGEFLRRGLAVGELALVTARIEELLEEIETARSHHRVVRTRDGRYRAVVSW